MKTDREPAWLRALAAAEELGDGARAAVWLVIGAVRLRGGALADAGAAWQRVFALGAPGEAALAEARQHLETLGAGGDLQAQRLALERLLAREDLPEERLSILARLQELGQALADDGLVEATCREALTLARGAQGVDELREGAAAALRAILARRGALAEILEVYAAVDADTRDPARAAVCLADAARFAEQLPGDLAVSLALRAWRRAPGGAAAAALIVELAEHAGHGPVLFAALEVEDLATAPRLALAVAAAALRHGEEAVGRRWLAAVARGADAAARREALARLDERLAASGPAGERLPVLRALVAELRAAVTGEGAVPEDRSGGAVPGDRSGGAVPEDRSGGAVPGDRSNWDVPEDRSNGAVPGDRSVEAVPGDRSSEAVPEDRSGEAVPEDRSNVAVPEDRSALRRELGARTLELARLWLALGELDEALVTCTGAASGTGADAELLELAVGLLAQRERWAELAAVCERRAALAGAAGDGAGEAAWLTRAAQVGIDHATQPRRAMHEARRLLLRACRADARDEAARASLVPLSFAEHRWDEVLQVAEELRAIAGEDYDVLIVAAVTEAFVRGRALLARAVGGRHDTGTLRRLLAPALGRVLTEVARDGSLTQLDAVLAAATAMYGSATRLRVELQAWSAGRALQPGVTLGLARLHESIGHAATARALLQLAVFMAPQGPIAAWAAALPPAPPSAIPGHDPEPTLESREALRAVLRLMAGETAGIRALGEPPPGPKTAEEYQALALAEADVGPLRAALGLELPVLLGRGGPDGGVSVRNDRPPALVVSAALAGLPAAERRFRLALAAAMIASGLAIVTDPQGASLPELLAALHHLADETCPLRLPGAQTIVRACAARGFTRQRLPVGLREALAREISRWQHGRASVARLAHLLRRDNLRAATRLSGALDGALRTIGRDARLLPPGPLDEHGAAQVLASEDAQWLLRSSGVFA